ncbi:MAG: HD domain-containing protein [Gaiellaceae bacterium MAG52_C11]|nr:HD domain-containing protein [Candidatus Gaiellasilicea maunaloa]
MAVVQLQLRMSEVISALSYALDITEGQPPGHAVRSCLIGMRLADELGLDPQARSNLHYALLLKDAGCSSNAAKICSLFRSDDLRLKGGVKTVEWTSLSENFVWAVRNVAPESSPLGRAAALVRLGFKQGAQRDLFETRCERGADIARELGFPEQTAEAIRTLDEHWDGRGQPLGLRGEEIPPLGRIVCVAQSTDVFAVTHGLAAAYRMARERRGTWFDPAVVGALEAIEGDRPFWARLSSGDADGLVGELEPVDRAVHVDAAGLDRVAGAFARVIDAKSPFTARHSDRVAEIAIGIGVVVGLPEPELRRLRLAALLHDIGKLGISNLILDKPGRLTDAERGEIERHPIFTRELLSRVAPFQDLADDASDHHEKLDGSGYPRGLRGDELTPSARILAVADIFEAMTAVRPYRDPLPIGSVLEALDADAGSRLLDPVCVTALRSWIELAAAA